MSYEVGEGRECANALQLVATYRGALNDLMAELIEGHIRFHVFAPAARKGAPQAKAANGGYFEFSKAGPSSIAGQCTYDWPTSRTILSRCRGGENEENNLQPGYPGKHL
jgi:hypothetical protein